MRLKAVIDGSRLLRLFVARVRIARLESLAVSYLVWHFDFSEVFNLRLENKMNALWRRIAQFEDQLAYHPLDAKFRDIRSHFAMRES